MRLWPFLLILHSMAACQSAKGDCDNCNVEALTDNPPPFSPSVVPEMVTGLAPDLVETGVRLEWKPATNASEYEIVREELVTETSVQPSFYTIVGSAEKPGFTDATAVVGHTYVYRVIALNDEGKAPPSDPVLIKVFPVADWVSDWLVAPAPSAPVRAEPDWTAMVGNPGGDEGATSVSEFPFPNSCSVASAAPVLFRPALGTFLNTESQTFSVAISYSTGGKQWSYSVRSMSYPYTLPFEPAVAVYHEEGTLNGCGTKSISFTAKLNVVNETVTTEVYIYNESRGLVFSNRYIDYQTSNGTWLRVISTQPSTGTQLSSGVLEVTLEYHGMATNTVDIALVNSGVISEHLGSSSVHFNGSGTRTVLIPYAACGIGVAELSFGYGNNVRLIASQGAYQFPLLERLTYPFENVVPLIVRPPSPIWAPKILEPSSLENVYLPLDVRACSGQGEEALTVEAPVGWTVHFFDSATGYSVSDTTVTGHSGGRFSLGVEAQQVNSFPYGTSNSTVSITHSGGTITAPVSIHIYDFFMQTGPPKMAVAGVPYATSLTVAGPHPGYRLHGKGSLFLWDDNEHRYEGTTTYDACGSHGAPSLASDYFGLASVRDALGLFPVDITSAASVHVVNSPLVLFEVLEGDLGPKSIELVEGCANSFHWQIIDAPVWLRFEALEGANVEPIRLGLNTNTAWRHFPEGHGLFGELHVLIVESGQIVSVVAAADFW